LDGSFFYLCYITTATTTSILTTITTSITLTPIMYPRRPPCSSPLSQTAAVLHAPQVPPNFPLLSVTANCRCSVPIMRRTVHVTVVQVQNQLVEVVTSPPSLYLQWLHRHLLHMQLKCTARQSHQPQLIPNASCCSCTLPRRSPTSAFARAQSC
jgi:hypothetical protein